MRLWSLHPKYLDAQGLVALWREGLLAQAVLAGETRGYRRHPQLLRFQAQPAPVSFIAEYLRTVHKESVARGYRFDSSKIAPGRTSERIDVTRGQINFEWRHLVKKLERRAPRWRRAWIGEESPLPHSLFRVTPGGVADWERSRPAFLTGRRDSPEHGGPPPAASGRE